MVLHVESAHARLLAIRSHQTLDDCSKWPSYRGELVFTRAVRHGPTRVRAPRAHIYCDDPWTATQTAARER